MALLIFNVRPYLIINTTANTFQLYKGTELVREGRCSTGSYVKLQGKDREWMFKTPKGYQTIKGRTVDPVWKKPDWANHIHKIFILAASTFLVALLVTHYILAYGYFRSVIQTLNDEVGEAVTVDSSLEMQCDANDSLNHSFRDLAFVNAQLQMAQSDSVGLVIDIPDSLVSVQIKGVNVYSTRIKAYQLDFILQNAGVRSCLSTFVCKTFEYKKRTFQH